MTSFIKPFNLSLSEEEKSKFKVEKPLTAFKVIDSPKLYREIEVTFGRSIKDYNKYL